MLKFLNILIITPPLKILVSMVTIEEYIEKEKEVQIIIVLFFQILNKACQDTAVATKNLKENLNTFAGFVL